MRDLTESKIHKIKKKIHVRFIDNKVTICKATLSLEMENRDASFALWKARKKNQQRRRDARSIECAIGYD